MTSKALNFMEESLEYVLLAFFFASAGLFAPGQSRELRFETFAFFISSIIIGTMAGTVAHHTPMLHDFDYVLATFGTVSGPATYSLIRHKTLLDLVNLYKQASEGRMKTVQKEKPVEEDKIEE